MRHQRSGKKLGRDSAHRKALYSNLAGALIEHGRIQTTEAKAKAVKPFAEKMITLGKRGDLHASRQALAALRSNNVVHQLFADVAPRFADRPGGYTRIVRLGQRQGDAAEMVYLELVDLRARRVAVRVAERRRARTRARLPPRSSHRRPGVPSRVLFLIALLLAIFVLPSPWGIVTVVVALAARPRRDRRRPLVLEATEGDGGASTLVGATGVAVGDARPRRAGEGQRRDLAGAL